MFPKYWIDMLDFLYSDLIFVWDQIRPQWSVQRLRESRGGGFMPCQRNDLVSWQSCPRFRISLHKTHCSREHSKIKISPHNIPSWIFALELRRMSRDRGQSCKTSQPQQWPAPDLDLTPILRWLRADSEHTPTTTRRRRSTHSTRHCHFKCHKQVEKNIFASPCRREPTFVTSHWLRWVTRLARTF